ncbi:alpha/beta fold hydrolase [Tindallia californiensis]|uniref:Pimeloyl-ACP methyl ester carboxylesterase n=1 Tax=Tindallia californiensis TaxID=159292 RepID=A0A1H3QPW9_9FIRM|nr:alpha/beta hydrolase [Tindallia californiensis]SDZ15055.1 Pimeloyl-ACP methyl ester carboxylesterase [Tindallia californiensis]
MRRNMLIGTALVLVIAVISVSIQYRKEMNQAYQRVADGSNVLITENGEIEYGMEGEGTPVLLIHGAGGGYDQGLLMGQAFLDDGYQFIAVSRFGYLGSPLLEEATVEKQAKLYADLLNYLDLEEVIILGVSAGGPSAIQFAHDYPERSNALILVSAVSMYMGDDIPLSTKVVNTIQKYDFAYWLVLKTFRTQFLGFIGIPKETYNALSPGEKQFADQMLEHMHPMSPRRPGNIHEANIKPLSGEAMNRVEVPTIIVHAKDDTLVDHEHAVFYHQHLANSQLISFDHGGHGLASELSVIRNQLNELLETVASCNESEDIPTVKNGTYVMEHGASEEGISPQVTISDDLISFSYDLLSSYFPVGTYEIEKQHLTMMTDDKLYRYTFQIDGDTLIFLADESSTIKLTNDKIGIAVADQAKFKRQEH